MYNNILQKYLSPNIETELYTIAFYKYKYVSPNILTEESSFAKNVLKDIKKKQKTKKNHNNVIYRWIKHQNDCRRP